MLSPMENPLDRPAGQHIVRSPVPGVDELGSNVRALYRILISPPPPEAHGQPECQSFNPHSNG